MCLRFDISAFLFPWQKTITTVFVVMRFCAGTRGYGTHIQASRDMTHPTKQRLQVCAWCQWHHVSYKKHSHPWENIREQLHISLEIWKLLKCALAVMCQWSVCRNHNEEKERKETFLLQQYKLTSICHLLLLACAQSTPNVRCALVSVDGRPYFQSKPTGGGPGTIQPKHLAETAQSCVHG